MEQTFNMETLYQIAEIELVYKSRIKASERPKKRSLLQKMLIKYCFKRGMKIKWNCRSSLKFSYLTEAIK